MEYLIWIQLLIVTSIIIYCARKSSIRNSETAEYIYSHLSKDIIFKKESLSCKVFISGRKNNNFKFNRCNIYILNDAIIIVGYSQIFNLKKKPLLVTNNIEKYALFLAFVVKPKKINPNSFNEFYVEFGEASFNSTNVEIRIKELKREAIPDFTI